MTDYSDRSWLDVLWYRGFYDVPRVFVIRARNGYLLFESAFSDALDDYETTYRIRHVEPAEDESIDSILTRAATEQPVAALSVSVDLFDETRRQKFRIPMALRLQLDELGLL